MAEKDKENGKQPLPPYISFKTFYGLIQRLHELSVVPDQIDSGVLRSYSNSVARQIITALKYLRLIEPSGKTTDRLRNLVAAFDNLDAWQQQLSDLIFDVYQPIISDLNLDTATAKQLAERFRAIGAEGEVLQKCVSFFVAALLSSGTTISPHIIQAPRKKQERPRGSKNTLRKTRATKASDDDDVAETPTATGGSVKFSFPVPEKGTATIFIPSDVTSEDWEMIEIMMRAYVSRLQQSKKE